MTNDRSDELPAAKAAPDAAARLSARTSGRRSVDLNCDFGESFGAYSFGQDEALLQYVTSVNIACGFHAGDPRTMREAVTRAVAAGAAIGAHPGLPDRVGFGRREMALTAGEAYADTLYQIGALDAFVRAAGGTLRHIKPHGALYHMTESRADIAAALVQAARDFNPRLIVYGLSGGRLLAEARSMGMRTASEVFADRTYRPDGSLTPRSEPGATLASPEAAVKQALSMIERGIAITPRGETAAVRADTVCLHGDGPHAAAFAAALRSGLEAAGIELRSPADD